LVLRLNVGHRLASRLVPRTRLADAVRVLLVELRAIRVGLDRLETRLSRADAGLHWRAHWRALATIDVVERNRCRLQNR